LFIKNILTEATFLQKHVYLAVKGMKDFTEQEIILGCVKEDSRFQRLLFEKYYSKMFAICIRFSKNEEEAKDILQEGFIKAFEGIKKFKAESSLNTWLSRIMVNHSIDCLKNRNKNLFSSISENMLTIPDSTEFEEELVKDLSPEEALDLLQKLPDGYRTIINLYAVEGLSHKQIGENLGISEGTSKSQLSKARTFLKKLVNNLNTYVV
jgi:RNA polymerase sigma-70 factor (ECF subfamily)